MAFYLPFGWRYIAIAHSAILLAGDVLVTAWVLHEVFRYTEYLYSLQMFLGVEYLVDGEPVRVAIDRRDGAVPVATRDGGCLMMLVGHTDTVIDESPGRFQSWPEGNTVNLDTLHNPTGPWVRWRTVVRPVKIAVSSFFYADHLGFRRQHDLEPGQFLQGALLRKRLFERVYFVVVPAPATKPGDESWWPRIVCNPK